MSGRACSLDLWLDLLVLRRGWGNDPTNHPLYLPLRESLPGPSKCDNKDGMSPHHLGGKPQF